MAHAAAIAAACTRMERHDAGGVPPADQSVPPTTSCLSKMDAITRTKVYLPFFQEVCASPTRM